MAENKSKSQERREAVSNEAILMDRDGLQDFYFPDHGVTIRAVDYDAATEELAKIIDKKAKETE